jgi:molybdopterin synthase catalytic subunit
MNLNALIEKIKQHPDYQRVGMILCHNGVVRSTSRNGREVSGLTVAVDHEKLNRIIEAQKKRPGIVDVLVDIAENRLLAVGDDVMHLVVAGDIRDNVIPVLADILNAVKSDVTQKTEYFA